jgi:hypothetical protein
LALTLTMVDYQELLRDSLPLEWIQPIAPQPSSVRVHYSHYKADFALEVGGSLRWAELDEKCATSPVFFLGGAIGLRPGRSQTQSQALTP